MTTKNVIQILVPDATAWAAHKTECSPDPAAKHAVITNETVTVGSVPDFPCHVTSLKVNDRQWMHIITTKEQATALAAVEKPAPETEDEAPDVDLGTFGAKGK